MFNCCSGARAGSCYVLAKTFPWYPLVLQSSEQRFPFPLPGDVGVRRDTELGRSRELAHTVPALQTEIIFFSNLSVKSAMWGPLFFKLHFILKIAVLVMLQYSLAEVVNSLKHLRIKV